MINKKILLRSAVVAAVLAPSVGMASGYKINEQSAAGMGTAHAGRAAMATDASVVYYNPAAMTELDRAQFSTGFTYINADGDFKGNATNAGGFDITGADDSDPYSNGGNYLGEAFIPFFYYVQPINEQLSFGLGIFTPFGTNTNYADDFVGGGFADETSLISLEIQPSIAFKINDQLSIGGGIDIVYMEGLLSKQVDLIPYSAELDYAVNTLGADPATYGLTADSPLLDSSNAGFENHYEVQGDDWGYGWNIGAYYTLSDATTFGLTYRSEIELDLEGDSKFKNQSALEVYNTEFGVVVPIGDSRAQASEVPLTTPASATLAVTHQLTDELLLQAGTTWTGWSSFQSFDVIATENVDGGLADGVDPSDLSVLGDGYIGHIDESWTDVWAVSIGATYQLNDRIALRAGYAFDESPVDNEHRTARVPSSDRQWVTLGAQYVVNNDLSFDVAAGYLFMDTMGLSETNKDLNNEIIYIDEETKTRKVGVTGEYDIDVFGLAFQVNYKI